MSAYAMPSELQRFVEFLAANPSPIDVVVGRFYMVPCAEWPFKRTEHHPKYIPLLGTVHEDKDIIGFKPWHIHADTRFLVIKQHGEDFEQQAHIANALGRPLSLTSPWSDHDALLKEATANLTLRRMKAHRECPPKWPDGYARWLPALENAYANASAACGICPHRQIPLSTGRDIGNGVRQCPGHGLCWDRNGRLVKGGKS